MAKILGVRFRPNTKIRYFLPGSFNCELGDFVIANTPKGVCFGEVIKIIDEEILDYFKKNTKDFKKLRDSENEIEPIIRLATKNDIEQHKINQQKAELAKKICLEKIKKNYLKMRLIDVECTFDRKKYLFYFSADGKIDFRALVRDLASVLKTRIELRQIGVRDQSKILGGLGSCGRPFCCSTFLPDFGNVSIKMAKDQALSLNPVKLSGTCGRLMCCLQYEQEAYEDLIKNSPKVWSKVKTSDGEGKIVDVNVLTGFVKVLLDNRENEFPKVYHKDEIKIISEE
ncbi:MAG: stage 0 sporulation family protein [Oscillospiraceae bacterium]|nr:stage 0 sporulation family protein [Oscillospiraceae bacterium]